jgi:archaetidylinositol phosphate synthase
VSHDTWLHRIVRAPVGLLVPTRVRPNHLTSARLVTGLVAAACFSSVSQNWIVVGAAVFLLSMLLDRADGALARVQKSYSRFGHVYDIVTDALVNSAVMIGIGVGVSAAGFGPLGVWLGLVAGAAIAYVLVVMMWVEQLAGTGSAKFSGAAGFDPDDAMLAVPIAMALGWNTEILFCAAVGAPIAALVITWHFYRSMRSRK